MHLNSNLQETVNSCLDVLEICLLFQKLNNQPESDTESHVPAVTFSERNDETNSIPMTSTSKDMTDCGTPTFSWQHRDFGHLVTNESGFISLSDEDRYQWLKNSWVPSPDFKYPLNVEGKKKRAFQYSWLKSYEWLAYSKKLNGGLCKMCVLFGRREGGVNDVKLGKLVVEPLRTFKKATTILKNHANTDYHKKNVIASRNFLMVMEGKTSGVISSMQNAKTKLIEENRKKLIPIIKTIIFCGAQNIPLRGHRDDGKLQTDESFEGGNFRALLKFRIDAGDEDLASHIHSSGKNASYISKTTQNEIIECCSEVITEKIVSNIKKAKYFTLIADETTDISTKQQLSICIRYYDNVSFKIKEDFVKIVDIVDLTGNGITNTILQELEKLNIDIFYCRGQAYDGGSNMSGKFKGVQARIAGIQPLAIYSHCANHKLNLAISKACSVACIRNAIGVISSVANFFRQSAGRLRKLDEEMHDKLKNGRHSVKQMCETRWVERHDAVLTFLNALPILPIVLDTIAQSTEGTGSDAFSYLHSILSSEFLVSVVVLADFLGLTLPLARKLQAEYMDVLTAMELVNATISSLQAHRENSIRHFKQLYKKSEDLACEMGTEIKKPRTVGFQKNRSNIQTHSVEEYFRISVYLPFLDYLINELSSRFPKSQMIQIGQIQKLLSPEFSEDCEESVLQGAELYRDDLPYFPALEGELKIWKQIWAAKLQDFIKYPAEAYTLASDLPNVRVLLQIICTLPVTSSTAERSFSALRRLKTYLRSTMTEDRLNGLAILHVHRDIAYRMSPKEVLEIFARRHKRKLSLALL